MEAFAFALGLGLELEEVSVVRLVDVVTCPLETGLGAGGVKVAEVTKDTDGAEGTEGSEGAEGGDWEVEVVVVRVEETENPDWGEKVEAV